MVEFGHESWSVWTTTASVTVTDASRVQDAAAIVRDTIAAVDKACSRFRPDSELADVRSELARGVTVSRLLADLVEGALEAAIRTDGDVDPTLGNDIVALGYDYQLPPASSNTAERLPFAVTRSAPRAPGWKRIGLSGRTLTVPDDLLLDLGASAKAMAADLAAAEVAKTLGCGVLVELGGDIATAGTEPSTGWEIRVQDTIADPSQQVSIGAGTAIATSSTQKRRWVSGGYSRHHILDPRFGLPVRPIWRSVTVAADTCLEANAYSTAAVVRGFETIRWFEELGVHARLVDQNGRESFTGSWPDPFNAPPVEGVVLFDDPMRGYT